MRQGSNTLLNVCTHVCLILVLSLAMVGCSSGSSSSSSGNKEEITGGDGTPNAPDSDDSVKEEKLLIGSLVPDFGLAGSKVKVSVEGLKSNEVQILFGASELVPDLVNEDLSEIEFTIPENLDASWVSIKEGERVSNTLTFSISEEGVLQASSNYIVEDAEHGKISLQTLFVAMHEDSDTKDEAMRLASLVSGEVVGRIAIIHSWQIQINASSVSDLESASELLDAEETVDYTWFDVFTDNEGVDWSKDPGFGHQRARNNVEAGADLYREKVHPSVEGKIRPFFMAVGVSEQGIDYNHADFSGYGGSISRTSGNITTFSNHISVTTNAHGSNVAGILAAELGDSYNAGLLSAVGSHHGGANISISDDASIPRLLDKVSKQIDAGATVINWSWGLHRKGTVNCSGNEISSGAVLADSSFDRIKKPLLSFFSKLSKSHPNVVFVSSAGNAATDSGSVENRLPTSIVSDQILVVGAHTTGGKVEGDKSDDIVSAESCFNEAENEDVKRYWYSNYGERVDISASGAIQGVNGVGFGTSYAAPIVAATVALIQSINPNLTPAQIRSILRSTAYPIQNSVVVTTPADGLDEPNTRIEPFTRAITISENPANTGKGARLNVAGAIDAVIEQVEASKDEGRIADSVSVSFEDDAREITKTIEVTIPGDGDVFDKVDIVFLVDVSGSYSDDLVTFRNKSDDILDAFNTAGSDVNVGLASFSDFPVSPYGSSRDYEYKLHQSLTSNFEQIKTGISDLTILSGSDYKESQLEALYQVAAQSSTGWRIGSLPLVFLATDAAFHNSDTNASYPGHGRAETLNLFKSKAIRMIGLQAGGSVSDVVDFADESGGASFDLSRDSSEIVEVVNEVLSDADNNLTISMETHGDFAKLVKSITPQVEGGVSGKPIENVSPGQVLKFDVVFTKGAFPTGSKKTISFRLKVVADGVASIMEIPVTININ